MPSRAPGQWRLAGTRNYVSQKAERNWGHRESAPGGTASRYDRAALGGESAAARPRRRPPRGGRARGTWRPGAEPMSSSVAGPDCCGGLGNVDFRQVRTRPRGRESREGSRGRVGLPASSSRGRQRPVGGAPVARQRGAGRGGAAC